MSPEMMEMLEDLPHIWGENEANLPESVDTPRFPSQMSMDFSDVPSSERMVVGGPGCPFHHGSVLSSSSFPSRPTDLAASRCLCV